MLTLCERMAYLRLLVTALLYPAILITEGYRSFFILRDFKSLCIPYKVVLTQTVEYSEFGNLSQVSIHLCSPLNSREGDSSSWDSMFRLAGFVGSSLISY